MVVGAETYSLNFVYRAPVMPTQEVGFVALIFGSVSIEFPVEFLVRQFDPTQLRM